jgi:VIT1/CCC1 family predicted Fe2+/Mn2+ transporter
MIGVASADAPKTQVLLVGVAGLVAGAMSMAAGEFVSVSSQRDAQRADIEIEKRELAREPQAELRELATIYERRGLDHDLAMQVAVALSRHDRLGAHMRDELGIDEASMARPFQAAVASAASFASFALVPVLALMASPPLWRVVVVALVSLASLATLGAAGAHVAGAPKVRAAVRVTFGGGLAMAVTAVVGHLFG